jgi:predicted RNase H-like HicB family nuclease
MKSYIFRVELEEEDDGTWSAIIPVLPGCAVSADTVEEAIEVLREAAQAYVEVLLEDGKTIPQDEVSSSVVEGAAVAIVAA